MNRVLQELGDMTRPDPERLGKLVYDIPGVNSVLEMTLVVAQVCKTSSLLFSDVLVLDSLVLGLIENVLFHPGNRLGFLIRSFAQLKRNVPHMSCTKKKNSVHRHRIM